MSPRRRSCCPGRAPISAIRPSRGWTRRIADVALALAAAVVLAGPALRAQSYTFSQLSFTYGAAGIAIDDAGTVYVASPYNHTIGRLAANGSLTVVAGAYSQLGSANGSGTSARFNQPRGLAFDRAGNLLVADLANHAIRRIAPDGTVTTLAGVPGTRGWSDDTAAAAQFDAPNGVAVDAQGNVYVADTGTRTIRRISAAGVVTTHAGLGYVTGTADGTGLDARFNEPQGVAVDRDGNVYVADTANHAIRRITPARVVTTVAGSPGNRGHLDATGGLARFDSPQAIAVDAAGNLFVADTGNAVVRKISPAGVVTTLGGQPGVFSEINGTGGAARFATVRGLALSSAGSLYLADGSSIRLGTASSQLAFTVQPASQSVAAGSAVTLAVTATGAAPLAYQWQKDGTPLAGATQSTLALAAVDATHMGTYAVTVTSPVSTLASNGAVLTVLSPLANDNFANAESSTASTGEFSGRNHGATLEPGEPTHHVFSATQSSVWYRWTPRESGTASFEASINFGLAVGVYTGTRLDQLTPVYRGGGGRFSFPVRAGTIYHLAVGSLSPALRGNFTLAWRLIPNDDFELATELPADPVQLSADNRGATAQPAEPQHAIGTSATNTSLWYRWTAPRSGIVSLNFTGASFPLVAAAYTGDSLAALARVPTANVGASSYFVATAGTTYRIALGSAGYATGPFTAFWALVGNPILTAQSGGGAFRIGTPATFSISTLNHLPLTYQWFRDGTLVATTTTPSFTLPALAPADAGSYRVRAITPENLFVEAIFSPLVVLIPPTNDNFANAQSLPALTGSITGTNVNATGEPDEPAHWNTSGTASSIWYRWTPATSGLAIVDTVGSAFDTVLAVYTGSSLTSLTRITQDDDRGGGRTSQVSFAATGGVTYHIAVGGNNASARGNLVLGWQLSPALAIATGPAPQTVAAGSSATFTVQATGAGVSYQWNRNGQPIPGATNATLVVGNIAGGDDASFTVTVNNNSGSVTSAPATLTVAPPSMTSLSLRHVRPEGDLLWSIAGNGNTLVTVGSQGVILQSADNGATWTQRQSGTTGWLVSVAYGGGQFIIVGEAGTILTSPDGVLWTRALASGTPERLNNVIFADGKYVAVGEKGTVVTSSDARVWTPRSTPVTTWLHGLAWNPRIRSFATSGEAGVFLYSPDGVTWTRLPVPGYIGHLQHTVAVESYADFVTVGEEGKIVSVRQNQLVLKDGQPLVTWSAEVNATNTTSHLVGLTQGAGALFATSTDGKVITATSDRGPWYTVATGTSEYLLAGTYHNNALYVVGQHQRVLQSEPMFRSRLANISTRGQVGTGSNVMISGFVITGDRPKQVLVRAAGPTLGATFKLPGTLAAPVLSLVDGAGRVVGANAGWSTNANAAAISGAATRVGAFPFAADTADSALLTTLEPGAYTAVISGQNNTTGLSIVEVYDTETLSNEGARAINISTRGVAGSGANKLIAGFIIEGAAARRVLIRAVGPALAAAPFNIGGTLAEPQLELYNARSLLQASAGAWGLQTNADEIRGAARAVSAFALPDGSKDAAMVVTLQPGAWTVQVGGAGDTTGVVLVEVYALP